MNKNETDAYSPGSLNIHANTVRRWSDQGLLKAYRITRRGDRRFRQEDIAHFLARLNTEEKFRGKAESIS